MMAKILLWNVPAEYRAALEKEARIWVTELEIDEAADYDQFVVKAESATAAGKPYTQIVAFLTGFDAEVERIFAKDTLINHALMMRADLMWYSEMIPLPDFIAEFNRTFHPWKK